MRFALRLAAVGLLVAVPACACAQSARGPEPDGPLHLRVLATHDFHGALRPATYGGESPRPMGGAAALKLVMDSLEAACACPTVRLDGGDQMQGTLESNLTFGASVVAAFNQIGLDAAAVGNHELDWGVDTLLARQREARYAWLAANVFRRSDGRRPEWARPWTVIERDGVRVGVVGWATISTPRTLRADVTAPYEFRFGYAPIRDALDDVWSQDPDFVVIVSHGPGTCFDNGCIGEMVTLAGELPPGRVHLIVGGHDHNPGEGVVNGIPIVRGGSSARGIFVVDLLRAGDGTYLFRTTRQPVYADDVPADPAIEALLAPYLRAADERGREPVATLAERLDSEASGDRRLGMLIADVVREVASADVGLHNPGGVRADLPAGPVTYADVHRVLPFDNAIVRITLTGRQLEEVVEHASPRYYFSNLRIERDAARPAGQRVSLAFPDGTPVRGDRTYTLATNDFLADGGDGFVMLTPRPRDALGVTILDALVERLRSLPQPVTIP